MVIGRARRRMGVVTAVLAGVVALLGAGVARAATGTGDVYVVHGIVGSTADIVVDGKVVAAAATPKTIVGPLKLSPGTHVVALKDATSTLVTAQFTVKAGTSSDVVAHKTADAQSQRVVTVFPNDLSPVTRGKLRLVVSHVAVAPPADIRQNGKALFRNVANGESLSLVVPSMTDTFDIVPTAVTGTVILSPVTLTLKAGTLTRIFAIGDSGAGTTDAIVQVLDVPTTGSGSPKTVHTGDGGQAADSFVQATGGIGVTTVLGLALGLLLVAGAGALRGAANADRVIGSRHSR